MWRAVGSTTQGTGHIKRQVPCQDKVFSICGEYGCCAALADGAGSAVLSHEGAECVTHALCTFLTDNFETLYSNEDGIAVKKTISDYLLEELENKRSSLQCDLGDLASTFMGVAVRDNRFIMVHLGDGIVGYFRDGEVRVASFPLNGDYANETVFTTTENSYAVIDIKKGPLQNIDGFVMMSDGAAAGLYEKREQRLIHPLNQMWTRLAACNQEDAENRVHYLLQEQLRKLTSDDCSLMFLFNSEKSLSAFLGDKRAEDYVLGISTSGRNSRVRDRFCRELLQYIQTPRSCVQIEKHFHLNKTVVKKRMNALQQKNLVMVNNGKYTGTLR